MYGCGGGDSVDRLNGSKTEGRKVCVMQRVSEGGGGGGAGSTRLHTDILTQ